ncbi:cytidine deaminase [Ureaplasma miroungigenitalium]|uniref:Cytidine deaminase n=1 Tax=Ureaplasma miroungigenitalium TaxID=1042321 RepID=A0ABT3BMA2_9BACT|nr:cytidine deaminase [Ureaplasma miroungigenitalium]MCV3728356.1 cytidine deaminase [Ureaplasma miroungigenitalium]
MNTKLNYQSIYEKLKALQAHAYAPYSHYPVASIVQCQNNYYPGVNVENGSYGLTVCAERNAIFQAIAYGEKQIESIYLITNDNNNTGTPCGACRQVISEFMNPKQNVVVFNQDGSYREFTLEDLLPFGWSANVSLK